MTMTLAEALDLADHASPMPHLAGEALRVLRAELERRPAVPPGWKLVPVEPTREMLEKTSWPGCAATDYKHMLAAAPPSAPHSAITHCDNCGCDWLDNGLNPVDCHYCKQSEQETKIEALRAEVERFRTDGAAAVRWAPGSAYWSEVLKELFGPNARDGIAVTEARLNEARERAEQLAEALKAMAEMVEMSAEPREVDMDEYRAMVAAMEQIDPATLPGLTAAQRCALSRFAKPAGGLAGNAQEPVAWVAADTLNSPHPGCVSSLAYVSQLDKDRGREYVPLYAAPVAALAAMAAQGEDDAYRVIAYLGDQADSTQVDRLIEAHNRCVAPPPSEQSDAWREGWARAYAGSDLYTDDGELQDNRMRPFIDFRRDSAETIRQKIVERAQQGQAARKIKGGTHG